MEQKKFMDIKRIVQENEMHKKQETPGLSSPGITL